MDTEQKTPPVPKICLLILDEVNKHKKAMDILRSRAQQSVTAHLSTQAQLCSLEGGIAALTRLMERVQEDEVLASKSPSLEH